MTEKRVKWEVRGRVQGVGFRMWAVAEARAIGVRGTVRNRADGAVEVEAAGSAGQVEALRARLERGPPYARVAEVAELEPGAHELPHEFVISFEGRD
jgi:acylphosphatase